MHNVVTNFVQVRAKFVAMPVGQHVTRAGQEGIENGSGEQRQRFLRRGWQKIQETSNPFDRSLVSPQQSVRRRLGRHDVRHERNHALRPRQESFKGFELSILLVAQHAQTFHDLLLGGVRGEMR